MKGLRLPFLLLLLLASTAGAATDPRQAMAAGQRAFEKEDWAEAAQAFGEAVAGAAGARLDPAVPGYNRGVALLQDGDATAAAEQFQTASRTTRLDLQQRAYFNRGNALFRMAGELEQQGQAQPALQAVDEALSMYEQAMALDPRDADPKVNYELALREKKRLEEVAQQQQQQQNNGQDDDKDEKEKKDEGDQKQDPSPGEQQQQPEPESGDSQKPDEQQQQRQGGEPPEQGEGGEASEPQQTEERSMTPEEAARLLDAMKEQEQAARRQMAHDRLRSNMGRLPPVDKDW